MKLYKLILIAFLFIQNLYSEVIPIDTVINYKFGENTKFGQSSEFFPANIFKIPPKEASKNAPASSEEDVCSIGLDGELVVGFKYKIIIDGNGNDFVVFENAFINPVNKKMFIEPGIVSVSQDGKKFIEFPFDTATLIGCAGVNYTNGAANIFNPSECGGDQFDIEKIGLSYIKYIKIKDFTNYLLNHPEHKYYDPILSGFDLDNVIGFYVENEQLEVKNDNYQKIIINQTYINNPDNYLLEIFDINGNIIMKSTESIINLEKLNIGTFLIISKQSHFNKIYIKYQ